MAGHGHGPDGLRGNGRRWKGLVEIIGSWCRKRERPDGLSPLVARKQSRQGLDLIAWSIARALRKPARGRTTGSFVIEIYRFRALVLATTTIWLVGIFLDLASPNPSFGRPSPEWGWEATTVWYTLFMVQVLLFCGLMAGLYFLRWWARLLALVIALAVTIAAGFTAGYQTAGLVEIPYSASGYLFGAMLGVAYLTPSISDAFRRK